MKISLINLQKQYTLIQKDVEKKVLDVLRNTQYIMGSNVKEFEKEFSEYLGVKNSISVGNGTDALVIALKALGIKEGDEVITTPYTFFATAESISFVGAKPVFVDVDINTYNMDPSKIEEKITDKTKAIMVVHIFGQACEMDEINKIAKKNNLYVIEDAAQAIGTEYKNKKIGNLSDIATFSFFPTKNLGGAGDGGMIVTNNNDLAVLCRALKNHGSGENGESAFNILNDIKKEKVPEESLDNTIYNPSKYYNYLIGHNSRLDEIQAAILRVKFKHIDKWNNSRIRLAGVYNEGLKSTSLITPKKSKDSKHTYHLYILQSENREELVKYLKEKGVATGVYYPVPMHMQKVYKNLGYCIGDLPNSEYLSERTFALPMYAELSSEEQKYVIEKVLEFENNLKENK